MLRYVALLAILVLAAVGAGLQADRKISKNVAQGDPSYTTDFDRWMHIVPERLVGGGDIYDDLFPNPPPVMLVFAPLTALSRSHAAMVWALAKPLMALVIFACFMGIVRNAGRKIPELLLWLALFAWFWPVLGDIQGGQTNLLMLLPLAGALLLAQNPRPWAQWAAGLLLALAVTVKVTPLAFLAYFLFRQRWRLALATGVGLGLWLVIVPGLAFGFEQNNTWLIQWCCVMVIPYGQGHLRLIEGSQSVPGFLLRILRHVPAYHVDGTPYYLHLLALSEAGVVWMVRLVLGIVAVGGVAWAWRSMPDFRTPRYLKEIACIGIFMTWASHWSWVPHFVILLPALLATAMIAGDAQNSPGARHRALAALLLAAFMLLLTSDLPKIVSTHGGPLSRALSVALWASVALGVAIVTSGRETPVPQRCLQAVPA